MINRLEAANRVLATFTTSRIEKRPGGWYVVWSYKAWGKHKPEEVAKRWQCTGQDFYPVWNRKWPGGGTASTALSQLIRWLRGQPVLPISSWWYWVGKHCQLLPALAVQQLQDAGYPEHAHCVLCGKQINGSLDWWHLDGISGPCCGWTSGCRQESREKVLA
ncbi:hypothetical protein LCGC14_2839420 [marine sediment metagenome]|uniref:Uncharacterized protein n=1 Tax=marine sediment metagenome TaxID=412755 RepID=A0A0F9AK44_9ZZZZ